MGRPSKAPKPTRSESWEFALAISFKGRNRKNQLGCCITTSDREVADRLYRILKRAGHDVFVQATRTTCEVSIATLRKK